MIHYRISPLDSNKTILEQLEGIKKYLTENPQYQVFYYNGNYINTTNTYEITNLVLNARTINKGDIVLFANSYYAVVDAIGNNNFVVEHAIEMNSQALIDLKNYVINNYQTKLNFDSTPTLGSNNPVTSDGIKKAITETIQTEHQVPSGGTTGQALKKSSNADYDYNWEDVKEVPSGGISRQVLAKNENGYEWVDDLPKVQDLIQWSNSNLTASIWNGTGTIIKNDFGIGYKNGVISIFATFIFQISTRTSDYPGIKIDLPNDWQIKGYSEVSRGTAFKVSSPYDESQISGARPYFLTLDEDTHSLLIRVKEHYTNVTNGSIFSLTIPLTYIKL